MAMFQKNNLNWSIQIIGKPPLIGKNNVWKHKSQKEKINCQQCYGGGHKKWKQMLIAPINKLEKTNLEIKNWKI